jgi:hypothetical protein
MNAIEPATDTADEFEPVFDFLKELCSRYHLGRKDPGFNDKEFIDWAVVEAGQLYIQYVLQPQSTVC